MKPQDPTPREIIILFLALLVTGILCTALLSLGAMANKN